MKFSKALLLSALTFVSAEKLQYVGVNESSGEFGEGSLPGIYNKHYIYPDVNAIEIMREQGMNVFRVCNRWERLQQELFGEFNEFDITEFKKVIDSVTSNGSVAIIDPHNYARYNNKLIGTEDVPIDAFVDFWTRLAELFKDNENVWFGLVNEPHDMDTEDWFKIARAAVDGIRATGAKNKILVPGNGWTGAWSWGSEAWYGEANADVALKYFSSEDENILFEVHQYFDKDYSGTGEECVQRPCQNLFKEFIEWLKANNLKGFVGEIGSYLNDECKECVQEALEYLQENNEYIVGTLWWAAGPWWGPNPMSIEPNAEKAFPGQMAWLKPYLPGPSELTEVPTFINKKVYCEGCVVTGTGGDGSLWGWENEKSCEIDKETCGYNAGKPIDNGGNDNSAEKIYCKGCDVTATGDDGSLWGWEDEKSCQINEEACKNNTDKPADNGNNTSTEKIYCKGCEVTATGGDGSLWGWENEKSCQINEEACKNKPADNGNTTQVEKIICKGCDVTATGGDGSLWGWENEKSCMIDAKACKLEEATEKPAQEPSKCKFEELGYKCCSHCVSIYEDKDGLWGVEDKKWCGISDECTSIVEKCWSLKYGYPCCDHCNLLLKDDTGSWGEMNNEWCGLPSTCA